MPAAVLFLIFVLLLVIAIPVSITLGITSVLPSIFDPSFTVGAKYLIRAMFGGLDSFPLLAVPMFVLSGIIMAKGGISKKLFNVFAYFLGRFTAGMPCAVIVTCLFYGAISGSAPATVAAVGSMTIPILTSLGYNLTFSTAIVAVAGGLGVIIPPSIPFIMYGMASGASVSNLFLAGIIPGLMIGFLLMLYAIYHCKRFGEDKEKIHAEVSQLHEKGLLRVLKESFFALLSPVIILGCIYTGIASPTEAAVISVFYAFLISLLVYRSIHLRDIWGIFVEAIRTFTPILFILAASTAFSRVLTLMQVPQTVSTFILENFHNSARNQCIPSAGRHGHGYHACHFDSHADPASNCESHRSRSGSVRRHYGCQPRNRICHTADRSQPVCCKLADGSTGYEYRQKSNADDRSLSRRIASDHVHPGAFHWNSVAERNRLCFEKTIFLLKKMLQKFLPCVALRLLPAPDFLHCPRCCLAAAAAVRTAYSAMPGRSQRQARKIP